MEGKLYEAAITGNFHGLDEQLLQLLTTLSKTEENPLHIASLFGHVDFVKRILYLNPSLAQGLNSQKHSPLHVASSNGHVEVAKALLESDPDVCFIRDEKGRTPLHIAAQKGKVEVLRALVEAKPKAVWVMTTGGDSILHHCVKLDQLETLMMLVEKVPKGFLTLKDDNGNTILHLLARRGHYKVIKSLVKNYKDQLDVNAVNSSGLTALDNSMYIKFGDWLKIRKILETEGAKTAEQLSKQTKFFGNRIRRNQEVKNYLKWLNDTRETLMVVAILMATVTFQAGLSPPGGVWQSFDSSHEDISPGEAIMSYIAPRQYMAFIILNSIGFVTSLSLIVVLVGRFSIRETVTFWTTMVWIVVISILLIYTCSLSFITSKNVSASIVWSGGPISCGLGLILTAILFLVRFAPVMFIYELIRALIYSIRKRSWRPVKILIYYDAWIPIKDLIYNKALRPIKDLLGITDANAESRGDP